MYRVVNRAQWFVAGVLTSAATFGFYIYGLSFIGKVKFQWWVWTCELTDVLKFN
jgi:hypothetical protein